MKQKYKRLITVVTVLISVAGGTLYLLNSFSDNLIYFYSPSQIISLNNKNPEKALKIFQKKIRIGGMIQKGSVEASDKGVYKFIIGDTSNQAQVVYKGLLPPMFREGQGIVAEGKFEGIDENLVYFKASTLITKHDENYMPPELKGMGSK